jgi:hypothetical protein
MRAIEAGLLSVDCLKVKARDQWDLSQAAGKNQYERLADSFDKRRAMYRWFTRIHQMSLLMSSAIAPVIVALANTSNLRILAILVSSLVAILTGIGRIFRFEDAWMNARVTRNALWREATCYHAGLSDYANCQDRRILFVERVTSIIDRYNASQTARIQDSLREPSPVRHAQSERPRC